MEGCAFVGAGEQVRFELDGDVRVARVLGDGLGGLLVHEEVRGPSALVAYGEPLHVLRLALDADGVRRASEALRGDGPPLERLRIFLLVDGRSLVDLMDLCDAVGAAYSYASAGERTGFHYRPAQGGARATKKESHKGTPSCAWCGV